MGWVDYAMGPLMDKIEEEGGGGGREGDLVGVGKVSPAQPQNEAF